MSLREYRVKQSFARYGLPTSVGYTRTTLRGAGETASEINASPRVVKCQIHAGGRDKAGDVKVVSSKEDIRAFVEHWLGEHLVTHQTGVHGQSVNQILVEAVTDIDKELYLGAIIDHSPHRVVFMASTEGGVGIEKVAEEAPHPIHKMAPGPSAGPMPYQGHELAFKLGLEDEQVQQFTKIFMGLATIFLKHNLALVKINPLAVAKQGDPICLDGEPGTGGNALFCQTSLREMRDQSQKDPREARVAQWEPNYVALDGNIGCMVSDVGLAMGTMDIVKLHGGEPANLLDVGGGATKERVTETFKIILLDDSVKAIPINIFGDITRYDLTADGTIGAVAEVGVNVPVAVRLGGDDAELGAKELVDSDLNIIVAKSLTDAAQQVIAAVKGK